MECALLANPFKAMRAEEIALGLDEVGCSSGLAVGVKIAQGV